MWFLAFLTACTSPTSETEADPSDDLDEASDEEEPEVGLWNRRPGTGSVDEEIEALEAIGYMGGDELASAKVGVTVHEPTAWDGLNFWVSGHRPEANLMDMDGKILHQWALPYAQAFPGGRRYNNVHGAEFWRRAYLYPTGEILAIFEGHGIVKLDRDSKVVWRNEIRAHHDLEVLEDGRIWVLAREGRVIDRVNPNKPVLEDFAVLLSPDGQVEKKVSLLEALENSGAKDLLYRRKKRKGDIFHTNSLAVLDGRAAEADPAFAKGNLLLSMRTLSAIMVLDPETGKMVWWHQGRYQKQHDPKIIDNGHMLVFDNMGQGGKSAVREFDIAQDMKQVWAYQNSPEHPFFSHFTGMADRFPNGNTLIAESGYGRVFEIDADQKIVWEYHNPARAGDKGEFVAIIPDMQRIPRDFVTFLPPADAPAE